MKIRIIQENCTRCLLCVKDCAAAVWQEENGLPKVVFPEACTLCSHCLSVCPAGAIEHDGLDLLQIKKINTTLVNPEAYETVVRGRRSIRRYKDRPVPEDMIQKVMGLAAHTPTATNSQNVAYTVITDRDLLEKISQAIFGFSVKVFRFTQKFPGNLVYKIIRRFPGSEVMARYLDPMPYYMEETEKGRDLILHKAPALILVHAPKGKNFSCENCNLAAGNIMNFAYSLGLGTCYIGFLTLYLKHSKTLRKAVGLPENRMAHAALVMGYPAYGHTRTASRNTPNIEWLKEKI
jgi:nitroreductase/NAD-dependent dihydropyrimidine dehydrogenase PreA subunit